MADESPFGPPPISEDDLMQTQFTPDELSFLQRLRQDPFGSLGSPAELTAPPTMMEQAEPYIRGFGEMNPVAMGADVGDALGNKDWRRAGMSGAMLAASLGGLGPAMRALTPYMGKTAAAGTAYGLPLYAADRGLSPASAQTASTALSSAEIRELQGIIGTDVDGQWGDNSRRQVKDWFKKFEGLPNVKVPEFDSKGRATRAMLKAARRLNDPDFMSNALRTTEAEAKAREAENAPLNNLVELLKKEGVTLGSYLAGGALGHSGGKAVNRFLKGQQQGRVDKFNQAANEIGKKGIDPDYERSLIDQAYTQAGAKAPFARSTSSVLNDSSNASLAQNFAHRYNHLASPDAIRKVAERDLLARGLEGRAATAEAKRIADLVAAHRSGVGNPTADQMFKPRIRDNVSFGDALVPAAFGAEGYVGNELFNQGVQNQDEVQKMLGTVMRNVGIAGSVGYGGTRALKGESPTPDSLTVSKVDSARRKHQLDMGRLKREPKSIGGHGADLQKVREQHKKAFDALPDGSIISNFRKAISDGAIKVEKSDRVPKGQIRDQAKKLGINAQMYGQWLKSKGILERRGGNWYLAQPKPKPALPKPE